MRSRKLLPITKFGKLLVYRASLAGTESVNRLQGLPDIGTRATSPLEAAGGLPDRGNDQTRCGQGRLQHSASCAH